MFGQLAFLLILGALENQRWCSEKVGIISDMKAYPENETFWREAGKPLPLFEAIDVAIGRLAPKYLDVAVDGTLFPPEHGRHWPVWGRIIRKAGAEIDLRIDDVCFATGGNHGGAEGRERMADMLLKGELPFDYSLYRNGKRVCLLTEDQAKRLAAMDVRYGSKGLRVIGDQGK